MNKLHKKMTYFVYYIMDRMIQSYSKNVTSIDNVLIYIHI